MRDFPSLALACALTAFGSAMIAVSPSAAPAAVPQTARALRVGAELLDWIGLVGRNAERAEPAADDLANAVRRILSTGEDISPEVAQLLRRDLQALKTAGFVDASLLRLMSKRPDICEPAWNLATKLRLRDMAPRLAKLSDELGERALSVMKALATNVTEDEAVLFMRGLSGRTLGRRQVEDVVRALENSGLNHLEVGEAWECISRAQLSKGAKKAVSGLRDGGEVVKGQHNKVHGIDGVGAAEDGRPVIFEFSMYHRKKLEDTADGHQLSASWIAERWNLAMGDPARIAEFRRVGVHEKYLRKVDAADTAAWLRKFVPAHESALTDSNRIAAGLGPQDLFVLGGN